MAQTRTKEARSETAVRKSNGAALAVDRDQLLGFYRQMLLIRRFEERAARAYTEALVGGQLYRAATNVGLRPTFQGHVLTVESHLFDFSENLVGGPMEVRFWRRLRDEKKFSSPAALREQVLHDIARARRFFARLDRNGTVVSGPTRVSNVANPSPLSQAGAPAAPSAVVRQASPAPGGATPSAGAQSLVGTYEGMATGGSRAGSKVKLDLAADGVTTRALPSRMRSLISDNDFSCTVL